MAAAYESAADLPRVYSGGADFTTATKERFGPVRFESFFGSFSCSRNPTAIIAMAPRTAPVKASMVPSRLPALRVALSRPCYYSTKRSGSDLMEMRD